MIFRDRLWISLRHMKSGIVGVILVVLATAVGVALAAATMAFVKNYNDQTKKLLNHPVYREVVVEVLGVTETELSAPVVEYVNDLSRRESLMSIDDLSLVLRTVPAVKYAYLANPGQFTSSSYLLELYPEIADRGKDIDNDKDGKERLQSREDRNKKEEERNFLMDMQEAVEIPVDSFTGAYVTTGFFKAYGLSAAQGSLINQEDLETGNQVIVLGSTLSGILFPQGNAVGSKISVNFRTLTVIGILESNTIVEPDSMTGFNDLAFVPHPAFSGIAYGKEPDRKSAITAVRYAVEDSADIQQAVFQLQEYFETEHTGGNYRITASVEKMKTERLKQQRVLFVLVFLTISGLFIAAINLFNLMLIRIMKHTKGIGIMIALGSTGRDIFRQFINESLIMSLSGAIIGLAVSPLVFSFLQSTIISGTGSASRAFMPDLIAGAAAALAFSFVFGIYPAYIAGKTNAAAAIKSE